MVLLSAQSEEMSYVCDTCPVALAHVIYVLCYMMIMRLYDDVMILYDDVMTLYDDE